MHSFQSFQNRSFYYLLCSFCVFSLYCLAKTLSERTRRRVRVLIECYRLLSRKRSVSVKRSNSYINVIHHLSLFLYFSYTWWYKLHARLFALFSFSSIRFHFFWHECSQTNKQANKTDYDKLFKSDFDVRSSR